MTNPRKKKKVTIYLDPEVEKSLAGFAARRDQSQSMIAEAAIASFLSPDDAERREAIIARRLDQLEVHPRAVVVAHRHQDVEGVGQSQVERVGRR